MTIPELITGAIGLLSTWALACLLGFFIGLHDAEKRHKKTLIEIIKEQEEKKKNDRSNL